MKKHIFTLFVCTVVMASCNSQSGSQNDDLRLPDEIQQNIDEVNDVTNQLQPLLNNLSNLNNAVVVEQIYNLNSRLVFDFNPDGLDSTSLAKCTEMKAKVDMTRSQITGILNDLPNTYLETEVQKEDYVIEEKEAHPVYLERGDKLFYTIDAEKSIDIKIFNADSKNLVKSFNGKKSVKDSLDIKFKGIYLVEIAPRGRQYVNIDIAYKPNSLERLMNPKNVVSREVDGEKGDFRVRSVKGISMKNLFEEPKKFTLRGQLKAAFSGSARALVAVQVPSGATDILYSLRISTNEGDRSSDGDFYDKMELSYRRVKLLGLPIYESHGGAGIISTLLGENTPLREEDAYINMYVFYNTVQAKLFQDGASAATLSYNVDYSTLGTQSCNGRIPSKGNRTIYLAFENERMRYNNYIWLEAVSAVPNTEYFKMEYTVVDK